MLYQLILGPSSCKQLIIIINSDLKFFAPQGKELCFK